MSPDNVASSITLGNFTVGRAYRQKKSDMPDLSPMPIFATDSDKIGSVSSSSLSDLSADRSEGGTVQMRYRPTKLPNVRPALF